MSKSRPLEVSQFWDPYRKLNAPPQSRYLPNQRKFGTLSWEVLMTMREKFPISAIFSETDSGEVSPEELGKLEDVYRFISLARMDIAKQNDYDPVQDKSRLAYNRNLGLTKTKIVPNTRHEAYCDVDEGTLTLAHFSQYLTDDLSMINSHKEIVLAQLAKEEKGEMLHLIGSYREQKPEESREAREKRIAEVDEVTALLAKRALAAKDEDEKLTYAFLFGVIRGSNIRSLNGACWAQEISLLWMLQELGCKHLQRDPDFFFDLDSVTGISDDFTKSSEEFRRKISGYVSNCKESKLFTPYPQPAIKGKASSLVCDSEKFRSKL